MNRLPVTGSELDSPPAPREAGDAVPGDAGFTVTRVGASAGSSDDPHAPQKRLPSGTGLEQERQRITLHSEPESANGRVLSI
jgi:hypothetical protein